MTIVYISVLVVLVIAAGWWLLIETEGVYLGRRVVIWLYDLYASRYDNIKAFNPMYDHILLAQPIMGLIAPHESPLVLDVATGTGRLPDALLDHTHFQGRIIGVDLSKPMLQHAAKKLANDRVSLLCCPAETLPFESNTFDVVTCLEALEFMTNPPDVLRELARVLRPGGILLLTNRINTRLMPGKIFTDEHLTDMLAACGIEDVEIEPWQEDYHRVWGMKAGDSMSIGARPLPEVLCCPACGGRFDESLCCTQCGRQPTITSDGIIDLMPLYNA